MKVTSALANKIVKQLEMKKSDILNDQKRNAFYEKFPDEESVEIPYYNFNETQNEIEKIDNSIMEIKHCINVFNSTTKVNNMDMTIDKVLVRMAQLNNHLNDVTRMANSKKKSVSSAFSSKDSFVFINYELSDASAYVDKLRKEIMDIQLNLDTTNMSIAFDIPD